MIEYLIHDPVSQSVIAPILIAVISTLLIRIVFGAGLGARIAIVAIVPAFVVGYLLILGISPFPPISSTQKLFYIMLIAAGIGLAFELFRPGLILKIAVIGLLPLAALIWLAGRLLVPLDPRILPDLVTLYLGTIGVKWCLAQADPRESLPAAVPALAASILMMVDAAALGVVAFFGGAPIIAQLAFVLASASGGYILIAWIFYVFNGENFRFGMVGRTCIVDATAAIAYIYVLYAEQPNRTAILILCLIFAMHFIASPIAGMLHPASQRLGRALRPIFYGAVVTVAMVIEVVYVLLVAPILFQYQ